MSRHILTAILTFSLTIIAVGCGGAIEYEEIQPVPGAGSAGSAGSGGASSSDNGNGRSDVGDPGEPVQSTDVVTDPGSDGVCVRGEDDYEGLGAVLIMDESVFTDLGVSCEDTPLGFDDTECVSEGMTAGACSETNEGPLVGRPEFIHNGVYTTTLTNLKFGDSLELLFPIVSSGQAQCGFSGSWEESLCSESGGGGGGGLKIPAEPACDNSHWVFTYQPLEVEFDFTDECGRSTTVAMSLIPG